MRILSNHLTAMDRQVTESINILEVARNQTEALNLRSEWAGAKIPGLDVAKILGFSERLKNMV